MAYPNDPTAPPTLALSDDPDGINVGLVGFWPLTHTSGSVATDVSTSGNDGTLSVTDLWSAQSIGSCFDGSTSQHVTGTGAYLGSSSGTLSFWFKADSQLVDRYMVSLPSASAGSNGFNVAAISGGCRVDLSTSSGFKQLSYTTQNVQDGGIYHIVATYDGSDIYLYVDGVQVATVAHTGTINQQADGEFNINRFGSYGRTSDGFYQNVRVFNTALTADQVSLLYNRPWAGTNYSDVFPYQPTAPPTLALKSGESINTGLVGWWPLTETDDYVSGAADISTNANDGTQSGGVLSALTSIGGAASFDGADDRFEVDDAGDFDFGTGDFSVSAWVYFDTVPASVFQFTSRGDTALGSACWFGLSKTAANKFDFVVDDNITKREAIGSTTVAAGTWYHVVGVRNSAGTNVLYVNGASDGTVSDNGNSVSQSAAAYRKLRISAITNNGTYNEHHDGNIQNVRVWDTALTAQQVSDIYTTPWLGSNYEETGNTYFFPAHFGGRL